MGILHSIKIKNFECFREETFFELDNATFFIGENDSGKSSVFRALNLFFGNTDFSFELLNKTERRRKQKGSNICEIEVTFDLNFVNGITRKNKLLKKNIIR